MTAAALAAAGITVARVLCRFAIADPQSLSHAQAAEGRAAELPPPANEHSQAHIASTVARSHVIGACVGMREPVNSSRMRRRTCTTQ